MGKFLTFLESQDKIKIIPVKGTTSLHQRYDRQTSSQDCYIELDCEDGTLMADGQNNQ